MKRQIGFTFLWIAHWFYIFFVLFWSLCLLFSVYYFFSCCGLVWNKNWNYLNSGEDYFSTNRRKMSLKLTRQIENYTKLGFNFFRPLLVIVPLLFSEKYFFAQCCGLVWNKNWNYLNSGEDYFSTNRRKMSLKLTRQMKALKNTKKTTQNWVYFFLNCTLILIFFVLFWSLCPYFFLKNTFLKCCGLVWNKNWNYLNSGEDYWN